MTNINERRLSIRERARRAREEERERLERLPAAICAACGGIVRAGQGVRETDVWGRQASRWEWTNADQARQKKGEPVLDHWRRRHDECTTAAGMVKALLAVEVSPEVAGLAISSRAGSLQGPLLFSQRFSDLFDAERALQESPRKAWSHVTEIDRAALAHAIEKTRAQIEPRRCVLGACAWCGVATSIGWTESPETWADGSPAPLCRVCVAIWDSRGNPDDRDGLRACALEALSGANSFGSDGLGIVIFADVAREDRNGTRERWAYAPEPLAELRERARLAWPASLPGDLRDEYIARSAALQRERISATDAKLAIEERERAEAEAERARAAGWPV